MKRKTLLSLLGAVILTGCVSTIPTKDIKLDSASDPKVNFGGYKTFAWLGSATIINDPSGQWEPPGFDADSEITFLINRELRNRGMSEITGVNNPDCIVTFAAGVDMETLELQIEPQTKIESLVKSPAGGLVIALVDAETGVIIWAGLAVGDVLETPDLATSKARLDYAVKALFKQLPK